MILLTRKSSAFTLIELLVVIAIIGLLASMLFPAIGKAKSQGDATFCANNAREVGLAVSMFADDTDGSFPGSEHQGIANSWISSLRAHGGTKGVYRCPTDRNTNRVASFAINDFLLPALPGNPDYSKVSSISCPCVTTTFPECADKYDSSDHYHFALPDDGGYTPVAFESQVAVKRHLNGANYLYVDGHVEKVRWKQTIKLLTTDGSPFIDPGGLKKAP